LRDDELRQLVYAWVKDRKGHAASANQPFEVR
jgi:hypothetical protein